MPRTYTSHDLPTFADYDSYNHGPHLGIVENLPPITTRVMVSHRLSSNPDFAVCYDRDRVRLIVPVASLRPTDGWDA